MSNAESALIDLEELVAEEGSFLKSKEYLQYQLPVKILDAAENISKKVMKLKRDTYGDLYFDFDNPSQEVLELKRTGEIMKYWVNKLLDLEKVEPLASIFAKKVETHEQETQVFFKDLYFQDSKSSDPVLPLSDL